MSAAPFDQRDGWIWYDGQLVPWKDAKIHVLSHGLHYASSVFEGERAYGGVIFKSTRAFRAAEASRPRSSTSRFPTPWPRSTPPSGSSLEKNGQTDAYVRPVAWRGSEMMGVSAQNNTIHLAIAAWEWPSYFDPAQKMKGIRLDMAEYRRPDPATAPSDGQGGRPLHDLHDLQAPGRAEGLCGRADARLAGPRRRMHRRQRVLHPRRRHPYADRRLLPRRHHAPDGDRPRQAPRLRGRGAPHHAGGTRRASTSASSPAPPPK